MKSFFRLLLALALVLSTTTCKKDILYLQLVRTVFEQSSETQTARICFPDEYHVSIIQSIYADGRTLTSNGIYEADGHEVLCHNASGEGNVVKFVRTFSHLKNTNNKNLEPLAITSHETLTGSVWGTILDDKLLFGFFKGDGNCVSGIYDNLTHESGRSYGWRVGSVPYSLQGSRVDVTRKNGSHLICILYKDTMLADTLGIMQLSPAVQAEGSSSYANTVWVYEGSMPAAIIFTSASTFSRIQIQNARIFSTIQGTYAVKGETLELRYKTTKDGETQQEACPASLDQIRFQGENYTPARTQ